MKYSLLLFFSILFFTGKSQTVNPDVIASCGDFFANSSGQIQWTMGEVMVETYQNSSNMLTQGFHQPFTTTTGITTLSNDNTANIFPNPASESVFVNFNTLTGKYRVSLSDVTGKLLVSEEVNVNDLNAYQLSLKNYSGGIYLIRITGKDNNYNQCTRLIKTN